MSKKNSTEKYITTLLKERDLHAIADATGLTFEELTTIADGTTPLTAVQAVCIGNFIGVSAKDIMQRQTEEQLAEAGWTEPAPKKAPVPKTRESGKSSAFTAPKREHITSVKF